MGSFQCSVLEEAFGFSPLWGMSLRLLSGILLKHLPSNASPRWDAGEQECPAVGRGCGAAAWGRAGPVPGKFSPSSWTPVAALIKTNQHFFSGKKVIVLENTFPDELPSLGCLRVTGREKPTGSRG